MHTILVIHGPNLNLLGQREQSLYGQKSLNEINLDLKSQAEVAGCYLESKQNNSEGSLVDIVQAAAGKASFIVINPAAYTHTSVALRDALSAVQIPFIEVHLSNIYQREEFRHRSYLADIATGVIVGLGPLGYQVALTAAISYLNNKPKQES